MCDNPFWKCNVKDFEPVVFIFYNNARLAICPECWKRIAESDIEWGYSLSEIELKIIQEVGDRMIPYTEFHKICRKYGIKPSKLKNGRGAPFKHLLPSQTGLKTGMIRLSKRGKKILEELKAGGMTDEGD